MNRTDRLMAIILLLRSRSKLTAQQLADIFEVSVRTIYRDIDSLCQAGVPIVAEPGPEGGYSLLDSYSLPPVMFTPDEAVALFLGGSFITNCQRMPFREALKTALIKIEDILPEELKESVRITSQSTLFDLSGRGSPPPARGVFEVVNGAILQHRCLLITYQGARRSEATERLVAPYGLVYDSRNGAWYLVGFCYLRSEQRMFHMGRIKDIVLTERPFEIPAGFDIRSLAGRPWAGSFVESLKGERPRIRIKVSKGVSERLQREWFLRYAEREETPDGRVILTYHDRLPDGLSFLLRFGADCEVLEPQELRERVIEAARRVLAFYGGRNETTDQRQ